MMERQFSKNKVRDPRWLRLEVCRDHTRGNKCERGPEQCRFAHPEKSCVVMNGKVTACYDSMKGRCNRESCKFYHPPDHIKKNIQALGKAFEQQRLVEEHGVPDYTGFGSPFYLAGKGQQFPRRVDYSDKLPICSFYLASTCNKSPEECHFAHPAPHVHLDADGFVTVCMDFVAEHCDRENCRYFHPPPHLKARVKAVQLRHTPSTIQPLGENGTFPVLPLMPNRFLPVGVQHGRPPPLVQNPASMFYQPRPSVYLCNVPTPMGPLAYSVYDFERVIEQPAKTFIPIHNEQR